MNRLTFVAERKLFSEYHRRDGTRVYLVHGAVMTPFRLSYDRDDVNALWDEFEGSRDDFIEFLGAVLDYDITDEIYWCVECHQLHHADDGYFVRDSDEFACNTCVQYYYGCCTWCEEWVRNHDLVYVLNGNGRACDSCLQAHYTWCEDCSGYYRDGDAAEHAHDDDDDDDDSSCCCVSPATTFTVRNDGEPELANDAEVTVSLPAGVIDEQGMQRITWWLQDSEQWAAASLVTEVGPMWQQRDGNFTKRLSRLVWQRFGLKLTPEELSHIGNIAREHSRSVDFTIDVTRQLNMSARDFGHSASCWWQSYSDSRCALKTNGGFGLRSFDEYGEVSGRSWVMSLKLSPTFSNPHALAPTFETLEPDAFVIFNGYGNLGGYNAARIVAHMAGMTYRKIGFTCGPMYVNGDSGYLVAPEKIATSYTNSGLYLHVSRHADLYETEQAARAVIAAEAIIEQEHVSV